MAKVKNSNHLSGKEVRRIAKDNKKVIKRLEAYKNRKADESEYLSAMRDSANILEIEDLHSYFFTEQGTVKVAANPSPVCR